MMEMAQTLKQAVIEYRAGRQEAFTRLYEESSRYIYASIYKVMGGNDNIQDVVCDIMQDTYVEISRSISQLEDVDRFLSWAGTIASRKCYAWLKKNKRYVLLQEEDKTFENLADDDRFIPEEVMQDREKQRLIREIIYNQLTDIQKLCIVAFYYNEQKLSEIAQEVGIPENTVKTNLSRARAKIKEGVVGLEKKQGIKLYSLAPLLLFMFKEDVSACMVPAGITAQVTASVAESAAAGAGAGSMSVARETGKKMLLRKAAASAKAKIAAGIVGVGVTVAAGSAAYVALQNSGEPWEKAYQEFLLEDDGAEGFDLNDFDEDGIPELIVLDDEDSMRLYRFDRKVSRFWSAEKSGMVEGADNSGDSWAKEHTYGYDLECDTLLDMEYDTITLEDGREGSETFPVYLTYADGDMERTGSTSAGYINDRYPIEWLYYWTDDGSEPQEISREEAGERLAEARSRFNEIEFTAITEKDIKERFEEFKENGNRERRRNKKAETVKEEREDAQEEVSDTGEEVSLSQEEEERRETTLAETDEKGLKALVGLAVMTDYFLGERMSGVFYNARDLAINMRFIDMVSLFASGIANDTMKERYADYAPEMEMNQDTFERYLAEEEIQSYLKNVFRMEDADLTGYMEGDRVVYSMVADAQYAEVNFGEALALSDGTYKISGTAAILEPGVGVEEDYFPFILTVTPNGESPFGYTMDSLYYGTTASISLEDSQYETILQMVYAVQSACISHWQMTEDFNIVPEEMEVLSKLNFAAAGARFGWLGEQKEQAGAEELAELYGRVTGDTFSRAEVDARFAEMQAEDAPYTYLYDGTEYEDGTANLYVHVRAFYDELGRTDKEEIEKDRYVYENRTFSVRDGDNILKINDTQRFFRNGNYIGVFGKSMAYDVPFAAYLYEDESSPTGYRLHYIHYYISESPLGRIE